MQRPCIIQGGRSKKCMLNAAWEATFILGLLLFQPASRPAAREMFDYEAFPLPIGKVKALNCEEQHRALKRCTFVWIRHR